MGDRVGQQLGNYHLIRLLGQGGFAEVYLGEHLYLKTRAAIKVLRVHLNKEHEQDFLREAQTVAHLEHPPFPILEFVCTRKHPSCHAVCCRWKHADALSARDHSSICNSAYLP